MNEPTDIPETELARSLGLARDDLKKMRAELLPALHWTGGAGRPVLITPAGQAQIALLLEKKNTGGAGEVRAATERAQEGGGYIELVVFRVGSPQVLVARDGAGQEFRLRVRSSGNFTPGMRLTKCQPCHRFPGVAYYHGSAPRRRGVL